MSNPYKSLWFRCTQCGTCCIDGIAVMADSDARRIMDFTGLPVEKIVQFYSYDELDFPKNAPDWIKTNQGDRIMGVRRSRDRCVFYRRKEGCTLYDARPDTCRLYPYEWELDEDGRLCKLKFLKGIECNRADDVTINLEALSEVARKEFETFDAYEDKVKEWNRQRKMRTTDQFLRFLGLKD